MPDLPRATVAPRKSGLSITSRGMVGLAIVSVSLVGAVVGRQAGYARLAKPSVIPATQPLGTVLWSADMETGDLSQWGLPDRLRGANAGGGTENNGIASSTVDVVSPSHRGIHSAKLFVDATDAFETPASGARLFRWLEPKSHGALYYSVWYYFPRRYTPSGDPAWWNVMSWKSNHANGNDPFFAVNVGNRADGSMYFYVYDQNTQTSHPQTIQNIPVGQWFRTEAFYRCTGDTTGHVIVWQDGTQIFEASNVQTRYTDGDCEWSVNNYSSSLNPSAATLYVDDAAICSGGRCP